MKIKYLFYGFGAEYVLNPLCKELAKRGEDCIEIDALSVKNSKNIIRKLSGQQVALVTSAHLLLDQKNFTDFYHTRNKFYSVLEIIVLLNPVRTIFIPHDLTQPFIQYESEYLNQFDFFLSPSEPYTSIYSQYIKTEEVGWIKYRASPSRRQGFGRQARLRSASPLRTINSNRAIWFLSDYVLHQKMGPEASFSKIAPVLKQNVAIKFPIWFDTPVFEFYFRKKGIEVYPAETNTIALIQNHDMIITNGLSSLIAESYLMGKTVINIMEGSHYGDMLPYLKSTFPEIVFIENITDFNKDIIPLKARPVSLKPFDMEKAIKLITK